MSNNQRYVEHRKLETLALLIAEATVNGERLVWVGADGSNGQWLTVAEFRALVQQVADFSNQLGPNQ